MKRWFLLILIVVGVVALTLWGRERARPRTPEVASLLTRPATDMTPFARATDPNGMSFPDAFGPHPDYQTEWWYYTGNLESDTGRRFGYQFTIFRRSIVRDMADRASALAPQSLYMAHLALTDAGANRFYAYERFQRGAGGLAGAQAQPYEVWLDEWEVRELPDGRYELRAGEGEIALAFTLRALKPPARQGINGLSAKSSEPGNASYYYSQTRLETTGTITVGGTAFAVSGLSWKDHEYGTSALAANATGWDWFSLQLSDGRELMFFYVRTEEGFDPASSGSLVLADGTVRPLSADQVQSEVLGQWVSPTSGTPYPAGWRLTIPSERLDLTLTPLIPNQELNVSTIYWEGAVQIEGSADGQPISGSGYIELTGYGRNAVPEL